MGLNAGGETLTVEDLEKVQKDLDLYGIAMGAGFMDEVRKASKEITSNWRYPLTGNNTGMFGGNSFNV